MPIKNLNPAERFIWDWRNGRLGGFKTALLHAIEDADIHNLEKLRKGFPDEVEGCVSYRLIPGWWDDLEAKMGDESVCGSCALDKHSCIDVEGHAKVTGCANHVPKEAVA